MLHEKSNTLCAPSTADIGAFQERPQQEVAATAIVMAWKKLSVADKIVISVAVLADIFPTSPRKLCIFTIKE